MKKAVLEDVDRLVELMAEFYAESGYSLNRRQAALTFAALLSDGSLGHAWLIQANAGTIGYVAITLRYSLEHGGPTAFVDDLFIRPAFRRAGLGTSALAAVRDFCATLGVRAMNLEVGRSDKAAQSLYRRIGFVDTDRQLLALQLDDPTHTT